MEVEIIFKIAAIGILTALISVLLKKSDKDDCGAYTRAAYRHRHDCAVIRRDTGAFRPQSAV